MIKINIPETDQRRVVIVGGGFAGLMLARKLSKNKKVQVVLIDKNNYHQFQPLFYQVAMAGLEPSSIIFPFRKIFQNKKNVFIRVAKVTEIDTKTKCLKTPLGICNYDELVLAIGATTNFFGNAEIAKHAIPMKSLPEALELRNAILGDYEKALSMTDYEKRQGLIDIVIVGGGPTGVEVAGALAEMKKYIIPKDFHELDSKEIDIWLVQSGKQLLPGMSEEAGEGALKYLTDLGVEVKLGTRVTAYDGEFATTKNGQKLRTKKLIWAAGIKGNAIEGIPQHCYERGNRICVNEYNQVVGVDNIYAIGDIAMMKTEALPYGHPQVAQVAMQQAKHLCKNLSNQLKDRQLTPFEYKDLGSMATIGRNRAVVDLPRWKFKGFLAWMMWLVVHLFQILGVRNKLIVMLNWMVSYFTYDQSLRVIIKSDKKDGDNLN